MPRLPAVFVSHGSPMVLLETSDYTRALAELPRTFPRPEGVVVISAHWQAPLPIRVTSDPCPRQIYDFGGFPDSLYQILYPAPGSSALASDVVERLADAGLPAAADDARGLDHGVWVPLRFMFPRADVPVVAVSLPSSPPPDLLRVGKALAPLRDRGILIVGSGGVVHNLRRVVFEDENAPVDAWAREFDDWVRDRLEAGDVEALAAYRRTAPHAGLAVPTSEHFDPLFVVLGSSADGERVEDVTTGFRHANLSMRSFALRAPRPLP